MADSQKWLAALNAQDLGLLVERHDFLATQSSDEEWRQEVRWIGGFGHIYPVARSMRLSEEKTFSFSAILLRDYEYMKPDFPANDSSGGQFDAKTATANSLSYLRDLHDFQIILDVGTAHVVWDDCNWTRLHRASTLDQVTLTADITAPNFNPPAWNDAWRKAAQ